MATKVEKVYLPADLDRRVRAYARRYRRSISNTMLHAVACALDGRLMREAENPKDRRGRG